MIEPGVTKVLLIEDDEDDFVITRDLLSEVPEEKFVLDWAKNFDDGLQRLLRAEHDVCLLDYRLGARTGLELLREALERNCQTPIILLTTLGQHRLDVEAMEAGAADYLVKGRFDVTVLERSIRYGIQRKRAAAGAIFEQARLAAFGSEVGLILTRRGSLEGILDGCAKAMVKYLNAHLAQIFVFDSEKKAFNANANAGPIWERNPDVRKLPRIESGNHQVAARKPIVIRQLLGEQRLSDPEWIKRERLTSYAECPLVLEDRLVGLMAIFTQHPLGEQILQEMDSVANGIALCIERKRSEEALDASESKYSSVVNSIKDVIFQLDADGNWAFLNPAWKEMTGFSPDESVGTSFLKYVHEEDREDNRQSFTRLMGGATAHSRKECRYLTNNGDVRWVEFNAQPLLDKKGRITGAFGSIIDITDRKLAEVQIQKLAAFPRVNPNPVLEFDAGGALTYANDAAREMAASLDRNEISSILPRDVAAIVRECVARGSKKLGQQIVISNRTISWSFFPVPASRVVHCYGSDITDVLNLEAQFRQSQKMECVGQLAAGVAHDINNVLTVVLGRAGLLLNVMPPDSDAAKSLKQIAAAAERAARFIRQLLMFSRKQVIQSRTLDLNSVIHQLESMLSRMLGEDIILDTVCCRDIPWLEGDVGMIEQVLMNLAVNARDAMPKGGKLVISTSSVAIDSVYAGEHAGAYAGKFVCLTVTDTGCGMSRATLERIFEPFFTTKQIGKGTGLGLATVYGIVKQHRGWIEVESQPDAGTTFKIFLPVAAEQGRSTTDTTLERRTIRGGNELILVVEDEPGLRELVQEVLKKYDYQVAVAASGTEALRVWDEYDGKFDLLVTDVIMPGGMTGRDLGEQLTNRKPGLKILYTSGYSAELIGKDLAQNRTSFLPKPFLPVRLAAIVRECLDAPATCEQPASVDCPSEMPAVSG